MGLIQSSPQSVESISGKIKIKWVQHIVDAAEQIGGQVTISYSVDAAKVIAVMAFNFPTGGGDVKDPWNSFPIAVFYSNVNAITATGAVNENDQLNFIVISRP